MSTGLSPNDIRNYEFAHQMRGYDKDEVREFLDQIATSVEDLKQENLKLSMERDTLRTQLEALKQFEDTIKSAAIDARRNADTLVANARREVNELLTRARAQAEETVGSRKDEAVRLDEQISKLQMTKASYQAKLKNLIESHLALIEEIQQLKAPAVTPRETVAPAANFDDTVPPTRRSMPIATVSTDSQLDEPEHPSPALRSPEIASESAPVEPFRSEASDPFGLQEAAGVPAENPADFGFDWGNPDSGKSSSGTNGIVVEEATEVTRKKLETFSTEPEPAEPVRREEVNAADRIIAVGPALVAPPPPPTPPSLDPELAAALNSYQQTHSSTDELTLLRPTAASETPAPAPPSADQSMRATPTDFDDRDSTDKIRAQAAPDEPDNTEHNLIDIDQPIGGETAPEQQVPRRVPVPAGIDPSSIAHELDEVAARFEEEMDRAAKS